MNSINTLIAPSLEQTGPKWRARTKFLVGAGAVVAIGGAVVAVDLIADASHHTTRQFTGTVSEIDFDVSSGSVRVVGTDDPVVTVDVTTHGGVRRASHSEQLVGDHLVLHSGCGFDLLTPTCGVDFVVHVPAAVSVVARGDGTTFDLVGTSGDVDVSINGGDVGMRFAAAPHKVKADVNGGRAVVEVPDDGTAYRIDADAEGGSSHGDGRSDPSAQRSIDLHASGGNVSVRYVTAVPLGA